MFCNTWWKLNAFAKECAISTRKCCENNSPAAARSLSIWLEELNTVARRGRDSQAELILFASLEIVESNLLLLLSYET